MLSASPLSVTYSFADIEDSQEDKIGKNSSKFPKIVQEERTRLIISEKIVNGKVEACQYTVPGDISNEHLQRMLSLYGQISDGIHVNHKGYHSGIVLFEGKASRIGENLWEILRHNLPYQEVLADKQINEKSSDSEIAMPETTLEKNLSYKAIFSGKVAELNKGNVLVSSFMNFDFNPEMYQNIKFLQIDDLSMNSEKSVYINQKVTSSNSVR